jgi:hypothetical protein
MPLMPGAALEANWALWHKANASDVAANFRIQLTA